MSPSTLEAEGGKEPAIVRSRRLLSKKQPLPCQQSTKKAKYSHGLHAHMTHPRASEAMVNEILLERFSNEVQAAEARCFCSQS
ncbi:hypothetical protein BDR07DRAFT_1527604 [Suillus spraguei]|nr:hypothetical protein BDR07DRAFT_1527604 [Suillus spraguei]